MDVGVEFDVVVGVGVGEGPVDDVIDAGVGRDRADERLPLEHSAMVGFFKSIVGLREQAAEQQASWLLSACCYLKARLWMGWIWETCANMRSSAQVICSPRPRASDDVGDTASLLSGPEPTDPTPSSRWTASRFIIG